MHTVMSYLLNNGLFVHGGLSVFDHDNCRVDGGDALVTVAGPLALRVREHHVRHGRRGQKEVQLLPRPERHLARVLVVEAVLLDGVLAALLVRDVLGLLAARQFDEGGRTAGIRGYR